MTINEIYKAIGMLSDREIYILQALDMRWNYCAAFLIKHGYFPSASQSLQDLLIQCEHILS